jgi:hypothetical protein
MLTYYGAQLGIALSVVNSYEKEEEEVNHMVIKHQDLINGCKNLYSYIKSQLFCEEIKVQSLKLE